MRFVWIVAVGFSVTAIHAQPCPALNFLQSDKVTLHSPFSVGYLQRQPDGSFTRNRYQTRSPFGPIDSVPNYQSAFLNCSGLGARTFKTPAGWVPLADQPGAVSQSLVFSDFLGNGTLVGLAVIPSGANVEVADMLVVAIANPDGTVRSHALYAVPPNSKGLLVADLNHDGKKDVVLVSSGSGSSSNTVAVFLNKGDGSLRPAVLYPAHTGPVSVVAFDFNGDNNLDLAILNSGSTDVSILLGRGDGTFAAPVNYPVAAGAQTIALGDFNGDGRADLVVGGYQTLSMLLGNGNGTFRAAVNLPQFFTPTAMAPGDFNKDGKLDLAVSDVLGGTVSILLGDGTGKFASEYDYADYHDYENGDRPGNLFAMDLDGDGNLDVVIAAGHPDVLSWNINSDFVTALFGRGDGTLIGPPAYSIGSNVSSMVLADFDGDGKPDLVSAARDIWLMLSRGGGNFKTPVRIPIPIPSIGSNPQFSSVAAGDFNGDGHQDLVVGDISGHGVYVLLGNGDGTFQSPVAYAVGEDINSVAVADFNGDGKLDIAACGPGANFSTTGSSAGILLGNGDGTFQSVRSLTGFGVAPQSLVVGDFNRDGKPDLAIANSGRTDHTDPGGVLVYLGLGNGSFQNPVNYPAGVAPYFVTAADVNGDKAPDLIVATRESFQKYDIGILLGNGNGTFGATSLLETDFGQDTIAVADLNGDGKPDLAIAHCCGTTDTTFMFGNGDGTFQPEVHFPVGVFSTTVLVTDLNGDNKPDLIIGLTESASSTIAVFLNISGTLNNVNGASFLSGPLAPDSFATAQGAGLATAIQTGVSPYPTNLRGTTVSVRDSTGLQQPAGLAYVSPTQVNYIIPHGTALGQATVTITAGNGIASSASVTIGAIGPGMFLFGGTNLLAANVLRVKADSSQSVEDVFAVTASGGLVAAPIDLGPASDQVFLVLYATGLRGHSSATGSVTVTANGVSLPVFYAGAQPQYPGLDQIDALLPRSLAGKGDATIQVTVDGQIANTGHVSIK